MKPGFGNLISAFGELTASVMTWLASFPARSLPRKA
jgi:hypothetical protein